MDEAKHTFRLEVKVESAVWSFLQAQPPGLIKSQGFGSLPGQKQRPGEEPKAPDTICTQPTSVVPSRGISSPPPGMFCHLDSTRGRALRSHISRWLSSVDSTVESRIPRQLQQEPEGTRSSGSHSPPPCGNPAPSPSRPLPACPSSGSSSLSPGLGARPGAFRCGRRAARSLGATKDSLEPLRQAPWG